MKKGISFAVLCLAGLVAAAALDKTVRIGGEAGWDFLQVADGVVVVQGHRGYRDITLAGAAYSPDVTTDLLLHFDSFPLTDDAGRYRIERGSRFLLNTQTPALGTGSAAFSGRDSGLSVIALGSGGPASPLFGKNAEAADFSIDFRLYPANAETGESIIHWESARLVGKRVQPQLVSCAVENGRITWRFVNFFITPGQKDTTFTLTGKSRLVPRRWSQQMVRFDSSTGMLEYLADGKTEDVTYVNATGHENGTLYLPETGAAAPLELGGSFTGFMDEFRVSFSSAAPGRASRFSDKAGRAVTRIIDLKYANSAISRIDARYTAKGASGVEFMYRGGENAATWTDDQPEWRPFKPGAPIADPEHGRYLQIGMDLYPDGRGAIAPTVSDLTVHYLEDLPPAPPARLLAVAGNGTVTLSWKAVVEDDVKGYLVYYGSAPGEYFGGDARLGASPLDVGKVTTISLPGLVNGKLYYFAVAAYDSSMPPHVSEFSPEAFARPSRMER